MTVLKANGHQVLVLANEEEWPRLRAENMSIAIDPETLFVVDSGAWRRAEEDETLLVYIPVALGVDIHFRAPKRMFREVHVHS